MKLIAQGRQHGYRQPMLAHYCPACKCMHGFAYIDKQKNGAVWNFNGDMEQPTFTPSMHIKTGPYPEEFGEKAFEVDICHYFLTDGIIIYLNDCTHSLAGKSIVLPDVPVEYLDTPPASLRITPNAI